MVVSNSFFYPLNNNNKTQFLMTTSLFCSTRTLDFPAESIRRDLATFRVFRGG